MTSRFDVVVIGSGPGGYVCAIRCAQFGLKVAVVEKQPTFGGTCLNVGCIPSKALLHSSQLFEEAGQKFGGFGIQIGTPRLDLRQMMTHKTTVVQSNVDGVAYLFRKNGIESFEGTGSIPAPGRVVVTKSGGARETLEAGAVVIATGSEPAPLEGLEIDEERIFSSTGALSLTRVPGKMIVVGAGIIGLELGSVWRRLGARVTVVEYLDRILPGFDAEIARQAQRIFTRQGLTFRLGSRISGVGKAGDGLRIAIQPVGGSGGDAEIVQADAVLVAVGRRPFTEGLGLAELGIALDARGRIPTDAHRRTAVDGIYAVGDVVDGPMLAHKAEDEGAAVAEVLAGQPGVEGAIIPSVVYTAPEIASVGQTEDALRAADVKIRVGKFPFSASGRARVLGDTEGFVKVIADAATDRVLGVHILGAQASEMIHEAAVLMEFAGAAEDLARICHAHPTLSESVREAAMAAWFKPVHL